MKEKSIVDIYKDLHKIAEPSFEEKLTQEYIINHFKNKECIIHKIDRSVLVIFNSDYAFAYGFRAEMDALPIIETNDISYKNDNYMHACGHDGHMAILLKLGDYILENLNEIKYKIVLIFQSGEESSGGAKKIIMNKVFRHIDFKGIFALHLFPDLKDGEFFSRGGVLLAKCCEVNISFKGKNSHVANKKDGYDAIYASSLFLSELNDIPLLNNKKTTYLFGKVEGGQARNIVSKDCYLQGTIRVLDEKTIFKIRKCLNSLLNNIKHLTKVDYELDINEDSCYVNNDENLFNQVNRIIKINETKPKMIGDDFGCYQKMCPCLYLLLGNKSSPLHSSSFKVNERNLYIGLDAFIRLICK